MVPRVLIGIVTHNRCSLLPKALDSAFGQAYRPCSVAVVDDASTDKTPDLQYRYRNAAWVRRDQSGGYVTARNELMARSGFDYFLSLDDDAWFQNGDEVVLAVAYLEANPDVGAVAFDILSPDRPEAVSRVVPRQVATFIGCGHMIRLAALTKTGFYAPSPGLYGAEEKDLSMRLLDAGYRVMLLPGVHVWHDKTALDRDIPAQHESGVCNDLTFALRRTPSALLAPALAWKLIAHVRFAARHKLLAPCWRGIVRFVLSVPAIWSTRGPVRRETLYVYRRLSRSPDEFAR